MEKVFINMSPEIHHRIVDMAAVHGMSFDDFVISRSILEIPNSITLSAMEELSAGGGSAYSSFSDFLKDDGDV